MFVTGLRCTVCQAVYSPRPGRYVCEQCGPVGTLDVQYDYQAVGQVFSPQTLAENHDHPTMWRYGPLLPVDADTPRPGLSVGGTPLIDGSRLSDQWGIGRLLIKDEGRQPTASLKDRSSALALVRAAQEKAPVITTASTGNAAAALAGLAAATGQKVIIFTPATAPQAKIAQLLAFGARVILVDGSYDDAFDLCQVAVERFGWYNRNTGINPYVGEGKKTVSLEILEQMGWVPPDAVFVSVGDGSIIGGVFKGFYDAQALGWIDRMPRIFGVQASGSAFLAQATRNGEDVVDKPAISASTAADSISADLPRDRVKAAAAVQRSGGAWVVVDDEAILRMIPTVASQTGVFPEPAAAAAFAGLAQVATAGNSDDISLGRPAQVVVISTGSGLKDVPGVMKGVTQAGVSPLPVAPDDSSLGIIDQWLNQTKTDD